MRPFIYTHILLCLRYAIIWVWTHFGIIINLWSWSIGRFYINLEFSHCNIRLQLFLITILYSRFCRSFIALWFSDLTLLMLLHVIIQMSLSWEWLKAPRYIAMIWLLPSMDSEMCFQISFFIESSLAFLVGANVLFLAYVSLNVNLKSLKSTVGFITTFKSAAMLFNFDMSL